MDHQYRAVMSFSKHDDQHDDGFLSRLCEKLGGEVHSVTGYPFPIFHLDRDVRWGAESEAEAARAIQTAPFFLPVLSPSFFTDDTCRRHLEQFLAWEEHTDQGETLLPLYYIPCPALDDSTASSPDPLVQALKARKCEDIRAMRSDDRMLTSVAARRKIYDMAVQIRDVIGYAQPPEGGKTVLIATLGEHPAVVSGMIAALQARDITLDGVQIIYPDAYNERMIGWGYDMLRAYLEPQPIMVEPISLPFDDAYTEVRCMMVLDRMRQALDRHQRLGNTVYLGLTGGRKHTAAMLTLLPQFYPCVQALYHLHDTRGNVAHEQYPIDTLGRMSEEERIRRLAAPAARYTLVELPKRSAAVSPQQQLAQQRQLRAWVRTNSHPAAETARGQFYRALFGEPAAAPPRPLVLIATLGESPMVVTQAYRLLQEREGLTVEAIWVIYPKQDAGVRKSARQLKQVCKKRKVLLVERPLDDIADIENTESVYGFAQGLTGAMTEAQQQHPAAERAILLSGGRKGMSALALLAAQRDGIERVYHTTIRSGYREQEIEKAWADASSKPANAQAAVLFLESPQASLDDCALIRVPVLPFPAS